MKREMILLTAALILIIALSLIAAINWFNIHRQSPPEFLVGVECAYGNFRDLKDLVDKVKTYTNLFVVGSLEISLDLRRYYFLAVFTWFCRFSRRFLDSHCA